MQGLPVPSSVTWKEGGAQNEYVVLIEPCYPGYGTTLGTALRRVLLSSLPGAAVVAFTMKGMTHEFSTMPGVKEDAIRIILALKKLRFRMPIAEEVRVRIHKKGIGTVTGADIEKNAALEVVNPGEIIATLTTSDMDFEMELVIRSGRGYLALDSRAQEEREIGKIFIDGLFSPIINVGMHVENIRVGEVTNFERLTLTILTDGTINGQDALKDVVSILKHLYIK